ncbi:hypothetical protein AB6A40_004276 [Gnathostoma spinigerum]|uniref:mitogen-activated protein kinase kinase n=1 Tax=Gnathostoma spinigerum TaxID=75299 RepID=A0ABD6ELH3_9BILA
MKVKVHDINDTSQQRSLDIDNNAFDFFDSFVAAVSCDNPISSFEYLDEEGDMVVVRTDNELRSMFDRLKPDSVLQVFIRSGTHKKSEFNSMGPILPESLRNLSIISSGSSGTVYKTLDVQNDRIIAVKSVMLNASLDELNEIMEETRILRRCSTKNFNPFIIEFLGAIFIDGQLCLCMEYMDGHSLDGYGRLPSDFLASVTVSLINGLAFLWSNKVMHRDIKPSNILVNSKGMVKLSDFGVSKQLEGSVAHSYVGSNAYMAPERLLGEPYRIPSDVWSLGLSLWELSLGYHPLIDCARNVSKTLQEIALGNRKIVYPTEKRPSDPDFFDLIRNCVLSDPSARWSSNQLKTCCFYVKNSPVNHETVAAYVRARLNNVAVHSL